jgi:hypothetical protein
MKAKKKETAYENIHIGEMKRRLLKNRQANESHRRRNGVKKAAKTRNNGENVA